MCGYTVSLCLVMFLMYPIRYPISQLKKLFLSFLEHSRKKIQKNIEKFSKLSENFRKFKKPPNALKNTRKFRKKISFCRKILFFFRTLTQFFKRLKSYPSCHGWAHSVFCEIFGGIVHYRLEVIGVTGRFPLAIGHNLKVPFFVVTNFVPMHGYVLVAIGPILFVVKS